MQDAVGDIVQMGFKRHDGWSNAKTNEARAMLYALNFEEAGMCGYRRVMMESDCKG